MLPRGHPLTGTVARVIRHPRRRQRPDPAATRTWHPAAPAWRHAAVVLLVVGTLVTGGLAATPAPPAHAGVDVGDAASADGGSTTTTSPGGAADELTAQGSVEQVAVTGASPGARVELLTGSGRKAASATADAAGATLFRSVKPGRGYRASSDGTKTAPVRVTSTDDVPPTSLYTGQHLSAGFGYLRTRDGTLLSINVKLPGPADQGPYPTVVEYSGYDPSNPNDQAPAATIVGLFGYATVGVNMRGTGCSGGAWDYFEPLQALDGYDAIETIAAQPWVAHGEVGMVGISYAGISQLYVAGTRPPHLAAVSPMSVIDDTYDTLYPGGIFNDGFALGWARDRQSDAKPAATSWVRKQISSGDTTCEDNQALRLQAPDVKSNVEAAEFRDAPGQDQLAPETFVDQIQAPVFITGVWQDEQTGAHFATMLDDFAPGVPMKATLMNGMHADSLSPEIIPPWLEFLDFYVRQTVPTITTVQRVLAASVLTALYGRAYAFPPDRFDPNGNYATQLAKYEAEPAVRVRFDVGAETSGAPFAAFETTFTQWPPKDTEATTWYLQSGGTLTDTSAARGGPDEYAYDPGALPRTAKSSGGSLASAPEITWLPLPAGDALSYDTAPLTRDMVMAGTGSVDLWLGSSAADVDLEVTISEVRPDGQETYVQSGWLRASRRALDRRASSELLPVQTFAEDDVARLPAGKLSPIRVPLYPFAHAFRSGSRVRITVQAPGGNKPSWAFDALTYDEPVTNRIGVSGTRASKVVLPVVDGVDVTSTLPACGTLRGQPCRAASPS